MAILSNAVAILLGAFAMLRQHAKGIVGHIGPAYLLWVVGTIAIQLAIFGRLTNQPLDRAFADSIIREDTSVWLVVFAYLFHTAAYIYIAVAWHRLALRPDAVRPTTGQMGLYLWRLVQQSLVGLILIVPLTLLIIAKPTLATDFTILSLLIDVPLVWVLLRFGLILPAAALGRQGYGFAASWAGTARYAWPLVWIALLEAGLWAGMNWLTDTGGQFDEAAEFVAFTVLWPIPFLIGLSILTYLYQVQSNDAE